MKADPWVDQWAFQRAAGWGFQMDAFEAASKAVQRVSPRVETRAGTKALQWEWMVSQWAARRAAH